MLRASALEIVKYLDIHQAIPLGILHALIRLPFLPLAQFALHRTFDRQKIVGRLQFVLIVIF